jgi:hypothetical protein
MDFLLLAANCVLNVCELLVKEWQPEIKHPSTIAETGALDTVAGAPMPFAVSGAIIQSDRLDDQTNLKRSLAFAIFTPSLPQ